MTDDIDNDGTTLHESGGVGLPERITAYLAGGGLFNPELANHAAVRDLLIECRNALQALAARPHSGGWVPIESAPKDGTGIYAFWPPSFGPVHAGCYGVAVFEYGHWCNPEDSDDDYTEPTHYMLLPPPPATEDRSQS